MSNYALPLGLIRYAGNTFEKLHAPGSECITASSIPDLFGIGKNGKLALAAHIKGLADMSPKDNNMLRRGHRLQPIAAEMYHEETGRVVKNIHARVKHDSMPLYASPDMLELEEGGFSFPVAGTAGGRTQTWRPGEIKVVAEPIFNATWENGPPQRVLIQHQAQLMLTGAPVGPVVALVVGEFDMYVKHWDIEAHAPTQQVIEQEVAGFLAMLKRGELPAPDLANEGDQNALIKLARAELDDVITLPDEMHYWATMYQRYGKLERKIEKKRKEAKARLIDSLQGHKGGLIHADPDDAESKDRIVQVKRIDMPERHQQAHTQTRIYIKDQARLEKRAKATLEEIQIANPVEAVV